MHLLYKSELLCNSRVMFFRYLFAVNCKQELWFFIDPESIFHQTEKMFIKMLILLGFSVLFR